MSVATLRHEFLTILEDKYGIPSEETSSGTATFDELGLDSLALVELLLDLQKQFGIKIEQGMILPGHTIDAAITLLESKMGGV